MKKIFYAILGIGLLFQACTNNDLPTIEQNPYRTTVEYTPGTCALTVSGTLTPDENYDWITVSQSGDKATFTIRRNTTGKVRTAVFSQSGTSQKAKVFQKAHSLDASLSADILSQGLGFAELVMRLDTEYSDDYESWGFLYSKSSDLAGAKEVPQTEALHIGAHFGEITGLEEGVDYYIWSYVKSTEGDVITSPLIALISPVYVKAGEDLQAAIDGAKEYAEIRVAGGATFPGGIKLMNNNANKKVSGGWNSDFSEQSMDNLTVIDGQEGQGFWCAGDEDDNPLTAGYVQISYFEIKNCDSDHGSAVHACGGPVTVHHCYVHDNYSEKGAIGTREEDYSTDITVYNCMVCENYATDGHGAAFGFGDGASNTDYVHATLVNNLIANNYNLTYDGYCSAFICYSNTELIFVNNTVINNCNYEEGAGDPNAQPYENEYPGLNLRGSVISLFANNLIVGNKTSLNTKPASYYPMKKFMGFGGGMGSFVYNIYEGELNDADNATVSDNKFYDPGFDISTVVSAAYQPTGDALGFGTLGTISFSGSLDGTVITDKCDLTKLFETYSTDLAGNPRVVDGKIDAGCYQAQ